MRRVERMPDIFHVDPWNSRDNVEQRVQRRVRRNRVDLVQLGGQMTNPKDWNTAVKLRGYKIRHVQQHRLATVSDRAKSSKAGRVLESGDSRGDRAEQENHNLFWHMFQTWLGTNIVVVEECF